MAEHCERFLEALHFRIGSPEPSQRYGSLNSSSGVLRVLIISPPIFRRPGTGLVAIAACRDGKFTRTEPCVRPVRAAISGPVIPSTSRRTSGSRYASGNVRIAARIAWASARSALLPPRLAGSAPGASSSCSVPACDSRKNRQHDFARSRQASRRSGSLRATNRCAAWRGRIRLAQDLPQPWAAREPSKCRGTMPAKRS